MYRKRLLANLLETRHETDAQANRSLSRLLQTGVESEMLHDPKLRPTLRRRTSYLTLTRPFGRCLSQTDALLS